MASTPATLEQALAQELPEGLRFIFHHISTTPTRCDAIFAAAPQTKPDRTYCESHLLNVSIAPKGGAQDERLIVLAIEIQIYTTNRLTTIFVSKADTTGYLSVANYPRSRVSVARAVSKAFIGYLATNRQRPGKRLVISLFARAQDQYLFPGSIDNGLKHVLDDRGLIKWWCRVLDPILKDYNPKTNPTIQELEGGAEMDTDKSTAHGYLIVPGLELYETLRYFPSPNTQWTHGDPLREISQNPNAPPRSLIPHFPDDPKARYLDELDIELPDRNASTLKTPTHSDGQWKSIKTLEQFWEMMSYRQECSSGRLVGFIWVVVTPPDLSTHGDEAATVGEKQTSLSSMVNPLPPVKSTHPKNALRNTYSPARACGVRRPKPKSTGRPKLCGPIKPRLPKIKSASSGSSSNSQPESTPYYWWPIAGRGELVFGPKDYQRALDILLNQNFTDRDKAGRSTRKWTEEVGLLGGRDKAAWGLEVAGTQTAVNTTTETGDVTGVNTLDITIMKKKRKVDVCEEVSNEPPTLNAGLVRKKAANQVDVSQKAACDHDVNVLGGGLVRKKPKT
ncbi:hypothetical protein EJ05DRAFT_540838 [Pseudovirgaria hyperparasitica]|uniref:histone acetyltransferase n=1 Tax=Pseudovirgaria hyperparasitica TaxID=470096 RepID=A0A6A6VX26_9PEZI|nr:uncharacterized protein EJ05DRAFT_540838 [Pseudovirgaria hyperparasitica]KAF2754773.1 hypothetical protein EJ05DRAFT_540838 [Pseudovirgaria hyperparasitica]